MHTQYITKFKPQDPRMPVISSNIYHKNTLKYRIIKETKESDLKHP